VEENGGLIASFGIDTGGDGLILALKGQLTVQTGSITTDVDTRLAFEESTETILALDKVGNLEVKEHVGN